MKQQELEVSVTPVWRDNPPKRGGKVKGARGKFRWESEALRKAYDARKVGKEVVVTGIGPGKFTLITTDMFSRLDVDPSYQRGRITHHVNSIISVLQSGGEVLDPVTLCKRPWSSEPDKLWIVDGFQRVCAFQATKKSFHAMVHESDSLQSERDLFLALNDKVRVSSNAIVHAWNGPINDILTRANADKNHPLYGRIAFTQGRSAAGQVDASTLAKSIWVLISSGTVGGGEIQGKLRSIDHYLRASNRAVAMAEHFLRLIPMVFPKDPLHIPMVCVAAVARERWKVDIEMPSPQVCARLARIRWREEVPSFSIKFRPVFINLIEKIWK